MQTTSLEEKIEPKNIIITGASSGIGFEAAIELAIKGNAVVALARSKEKLKNLNQIVKSLNPDANFFAVEFDILNDDEQGLVDFIKQRFNKVDILINNAGALINKPFKELTEFDMAEMYQSNVLGHFRMIKALLPMMNTNSHIVNIGSMGGFQGSSKFAGLSIYSASKAALANLTECLANELGIHGVKVNCFALGAVNTEMLRQAFPNYNSSTQPNQVAKIIADFSLNWGDCVSGQIIPLTFSNPS